MNKILPIILLGTSFTSCTQGGDMQPEKQPNIVLIIGDDISWNDYGCYGNPDVKTPNIDNLATEGIKFTNAYLTASSCSPSRCSIITGRYPHNTGAHELRLPLPMDQLLFPKVLKENGYYTAHAGKWHFGVNEFSGPGLEAFDSYGNDSDGGKKDGGEEQWVNRIKNRPQDKAFFMWFASNDAHRKWSADSFLPPHNPDSLNVPPFLIDDAATRNDLASYYNEIARFDFYIGEVVKELSKQGVLDNTVILVLADNGRPFPRCKTRVYDSGMKTGLIFRWGDKIDQGITSDALVSVIDIAPTLLDIAGIKAGKTFQGRSFAGLFDNPDAEFRNYIFSEHNWHDYESYERQVRTKDFMFIYNGRPLLNNIGGADVVRSPSMKSLFNAHESNLLTDAQSDIFLGPRPVKEFYNCRKDPLQLNNIIDDKNYINQIEELERILKKWQKQTGDTEPAIITKDHFDRKTGAFLLGEAEKINKTVIRGEIPGKSKHATNINHPGPF